jgi:hypothetical protein
MSHLSKEDEELKAQIREMFPNGTDEQFINSMFHSIRGKQMLWDLLDDGNQNKKLPNITQ